jgi:hypothetical protein
MPSLPDTKKLVQLSWFGESMKNRIASVRVYVTTQVVNAREFIYRLGSYVDGGKVQGTLREGSFKLPHGECVISNAHL